jgi:Domain of unknown function (DUF4386)
VGFAVELFYCLCNIPLTLVLYDLFKVVNKPVAVVTMVFSFVGTAIGGINLLADFAPLVLLGKGAYLAAFTEGQLQAAAYLSLRFYETGFAIALTCFGSFASRRRTCALWLLVVGVNVQRWREQAAS